jgi:DNA-binding PadR family transcriptional regulator
MRGGFPPGFSPFGGPQQPRRGRGDVRLVVLGLLAEEPMHGYQLIREVARRSEGSWRLSPGSVYPMLSQLEDDGLVVADDSACRRSFGLTEAGRAEAESRADEFDELWADPADPDAQGWHDLAGLVAQVAAAAVQVGSEGTQTQRERAATLLEDTRRSLYRLLAEADGEQTS